MDMSNKPTQEHLLDQIDTLIDWVALTPQMQAISTRTRSSLLLATVKMALLGRWYGLSGPLLREACQDRLSFRRFLGLTAQPDNAEAIDSYCDDLEEVAAEMQDLINAVEAQLL